jgi:hypothetical protein
VIGILFTLSKWFLIQYSSSQSPGKTCRLEAEPAAHLITGPTTKTATEPSSPPVAMSQSADLQDLVVWEYERSNSEADRCHMAARTEVSQTHSRRAAPCRLVAVLREQRLRATRAGPAPSELHITVPGNRLTLLDDIAVVFTEERWLVSMSDCVSLKCGETQQSEITSTLGAKLR